MLSTYAPVVVIAFLALTTSTVLCAQTALPVAQVSEAYKQMLLQVLSKNPSIHLANRQLNVATFDKASARWQYFPTPSIGMEQSSNESKFENSVTSFVRLQQPVWTGGKLDAQLERATAQEKITLSALEEQKLNVVLNWIGLWGEVQGAEWRISAYRESERQHLDYVQKVGRRVNEGQSAASDLQLSRSRLSSVQADLTLAVSQQKNAISKLKRIWGDTWPIDLVTDNPNFQQKIIDWLVVDTSEWIAAIYEKHPSIQKLTANEELLTAELKITRSKAYPDVYLRAEISDGNISGTNKLLYFGVTSSLGAGLSTFSSVSAAKAKLNSVSDEMEMLRRSLADQIQMDVETLATQSRRIEYFQSSLIDSREYLESSQRQFLNGRKSWQDLMNTERERSALLVQLADSKTQVWIAMQRLTVQSLGLDAYLGLSGSVNR